MQRMLESSTRKREAIWRAWVVPQRMAAACLAWNADNHHVCFVWIGCLILKEGVVVIADSMTPDPDAGGAWSGVYRETSVGWTGHPIRS